MDFWLELPLSTPLYNNVAVFVLMVIYYRLAMELAAWFHVRFPQFGEVRQMLQMVFSSLVIFWPLFDRSDGWSWRFNALVPAIMASRLVYKGAILRDPDDQDVENFSSLSRLPTNLLFGPLQMALLMVWLGLYQFMTVEAAIIVAAVGVGDGIAPMIGARYGRHMFQMPFGNVKTMEGTVVGVFCWTTAGIYTYMYLMGLFPILPLRMVLAYSAIAAVTEATAPESLDNVIMAVVLHLSMDRVHDAFETLDELVRGAVMPGSY
jgi:CDP-diglyceride synthetase